MRCPKELSISLLSIMNSWNYSPTYSQDSVQFFASLCGPCKNTGRRHAMFAKRSSSAIRSPLLFRTGVKIFMCLVENVAHRVLDRSIHHIDSGRSAPDARTWGVLIGDQALSDSGCVRCRLVCDVCFCAGKTRIRSPSSSCYGRKLDQIYFRLGESIRDITFLPGDFIETTRNSRHQRFSPMGGNKFQPLGEERVATPTVSPIKARRGAYLSRLPPRSIMIARCCSAAPAVPPQGV